MNLRDLAAADLREGIAQARAEREASLEARDRELSEARYGEDYENTMYPPANRHVLSCGCVASRPSRRDEFEIAECPEHE